MKRAIRDRDMLETREGFFFTVVGHVHPPDRFFAYLKYLPREETGIGIWEKDNIRFQRMIPEYSAEIVTNTFKFLEENHPEYLFACPINNIQMSAVPRNRIQNWYFSSCEFQRLIKKRKRDQLEEQVVQLAKLLMDQFNLMPDDIGITGSVALQIHHPRYSDIDLIVFGRNTAKMLSEELQSFFSAHPSFHPLPRTEREAIIRRKAALFGLSRETTKILLDRKWNLGIFEGTRFAILPVRRAGEVEETYGDRVYHSLGNATIVAEILDAQDSFFNPAIYRVSVQKFMDGPKVSNLKVLLSWENFFANVAREEETVLAKGKVERVDDVKNNETWYRLLIGSGTGGTEYIIPYKTSEITQMGGY